MQIIAIHCSNQHYMSHLMGNEFDFLFCLFELEITPYKTNISFGLVGCSLSAYIL